MRAAPDSGFRSKRVKHRHISVVVEQVNSVPAYRVLCVKCCNKRT
jgi:hypothetical protein